MMKPLDNARSLDKRSDGSVWAQSGGGFHSVEV